MIKIVAAMLTLSAAGLCMAQVSSAHSAAPSPKRYRLTFVLTYPQGNGSPQSFALDVPVTPDHPGVANMSMAAGPTGQVEGSIQQTLQCTDVHQSATGLAAKVSFTSDSVSPEPLPGSDEHLHNNLTFERRIDIALAKPTRITEEMHERPLKPGDEVFSGKRPPEPQITVTVTEL